MSSTPVTATPAAPSAPPSDGHSSPTPGVTFIPTPFTLASPEQSSQPSFAQASMSGTTLRTTASQTSAAPSAPSSSVPSSSATPLRLSFTTSSDNHLSTTSTPPSSVRPTTPSTTTVSTTTLLSSSTATPQPSTTASSSLLSIDPSTSKTLLTTSSSSPVSTMLQSSSAQSAVDRPLTTVLEGTTIFVTSTNSQGQVVTSVPPVITEVITTTGSGGIATTVTQAIVNPTLASNNNTTGVSSFFTDTGAVVGVFVVVGLATASIIMWIMFAVRRRQRMRRIEQDTVIEAAVIAAGLNRAPLDDDDEVDSPTSLNTRRRLSSGLDPSILLGLEGSLPTSTRVSEVPDDTTRASTGSHPEHPAISHRKGYAPARTTSPSSRAGQFTDDIVSSRGRKSSYGHTPTYSAGSFEPLLANYVQNMSDLDGPPVELPRDRSSPNLGGSLSRNGYSSDGSPRDGSRVSLKKQNSSDSSALRDVDDYAHYVLTVRNVSDDQSQHSA